MLEMVHSLLDRARYLYCRRRGYFQSRLWNRILEGTQLARHAVEIEMEMAD